MRKQIIRTEPSKILVGVSKAGNNKYKKNPNSKPFKNKNGTIRIVKHY